MRWEWRFAFAWTHAGQWLLMSGRGYVVYIETTRVNKHRICIVVVAAWKPFDKKDNKQNNIWIMNVNGWLNVPLGLEYQRDANMRWKIRWSQHHVCGCTEPGFHNNESILTFSDLRKRDASFSSSCLKHRWRHWRSDACRSGWPAITNWMKTEILLAFIEISSRWRPRGNTSQFCA